MTDNPFNAEGGFDLQAMLAQAQEMQSQLMAAQEQLASTTVQGTAGGVTATVTGTGDLTAVSITAGSFDGADADSLTDLGDLVVAAYRDAKSKVDDLAAEALGPFAGGLGAPGEEPGGLPGGPVGFGV